MKRILWIGVSFLLLVGFGFFIKIPEMSSDAMWVLGIFASGLVLWITQGIEWPTLYVLLALGLVPSFGMKTMVQSAFGNTIFSFLLFSFMSTYALSTTPLVKNIATSAMRLPFAQKGAKSLLWMLLTSVLIVGLFISPTVLFFIVYPIFEEILNAMGIKKGSPFGAALMIGCIMVLSLSSGMTPIGHVFPVLAMSVYESLAGSSISFGSYMLFAIPFGLLCFVIIGGVLTTFFKFDSIENSALEEHKPVAFVKRDWMIVGIFALMILLWVFPSMFGGIFPDVSKYIGKLDTAFPALLGVLLMSVISIEGQPLLKISDALSKGIPWISLLLSGATLALGAALTHGDIGIMEGLKAGLGPVISTWPSYGFVAVFVIWTLFQSNVSSHMVTAQVISAVAVPIALVGSGLNAAAITMVIGLLASVGSSTPGAMPYVAIVGGSGWSNPKEIVRVGVLISVIIAIVTILIGYPMAHWIAS